MTDENQSSNNNESSEEQKLSRRRFIRNSGIAAGGLVVGGVAGSVIPWEGTEENQEENATQNAGKQTENKNYNQALMFFTQGEFKVIEPAVERIYPEDDNGPGAKELGVGFYIDHQLAGEWGFNAREYMEPPFFHGEKVQGYQGRLKRREIFRIALQEMQNYSQQKYDKKFENLDENKQINILKDFQKDNIDLTTISPNGFFEMLRSAVLQGVYADPLYGGNKNMEGWRMRNYPGDQMSYKDIIEKDFQEMEPLSLHDHMSD